MTEKEKMQRGLLYNANSDEELPAERIHAKELCRLFNQLRPVQTEKQQEILKELFGRIEGDLQVVAPFWCDYGYHIEVGHRCFVNHNCLILDAAKVVFGDSVFVGPNCGFYTASYPLDATIRNQGLEYAKPIQIGNNVWIGAGVQVLPGVTIGNNAVIGAGSVVTKSIPDNAVADGNPCKVIYYITE